MPQAAIAGVGYTAFSRNSARSVLDLASEAALNACEDAGVDPRSVDGIASHLIAGDSESSEAVATALATEQMRYCFDFNMGGQAPAFLIGEAARAIESGVAETVIVFRALNGRSGARVGTAKMPGGAAQYRYPIGYNAYLMYIAMWAQRFLHETGQTDEALGAVAVTQRAYAELNERAMIRRPLSLDDHADSPWVAEPFRVADCTTEVDGAVALLVTSIERARDLRHPAAVVANSVWHAGPRPGLDIGNHVLYDDYTYNFTSYLRESLFGKVGIRPSDVDFAQIYDCFSSTVLMGLEGLGFCERGQSGDFVRAGNTAPGGSLPVNTNGGMLSEGYVHGMNTVAEAVLQIQGRCGDRQVGRHEVGVVTSGALVDGSALVLTADR